MLTDYYIIILDYVQLFFFQKSYIYLKVYHLVQLLEQILIYVLKKMSYTIIVIMEKQKRSFKIWPYIKLFMVIIL